MAGRSTAGSWLAGGWAELRALLTTNVEIARLTRGFGPQPPGRAPGVENARRHIGGDDADGAHKPIPGAHTATTMLPRSGPSPGRARDGVADRQAQRLGRDQQGTDLLVHSDRCLGVPPPLAKTGGRQFGEGGN
jgi:hypothetical protein